MAGRLTTLDGSGLAQVAQDAFENVAPDSATVEFGMDLKVEADKLTALLIPGSGIASLTVTLRRELLTDRPLPKPAPGQPPALAAAP